MKNNKKTMILSVVAIATFAILVIGATYAYFTAQGGEPTSANLNVTTYTTDVFTFTTGDDINIYADQSTFASGKGNATGSTFARATLTANNKTNTATEHYYLYLNIESNTFTYSINESTPEIIMTVTDSSGTEITDIPTLNHVIVTGANNTQVSGYDITNKSGLITLFNNREITASPSKEETWNITITFVNYDENQNANAGKSMSAKLIIRKNELMNDISEVCSGGEKLSDCIISLSEKGVSGATKVYHHGANLLNGARDNSYRFAGGESHGDYYSCKYDGNDVMNKNSQINLASKGDCSNIYKITIGTNVDYGDNSFSTILINKKTVNWDSTNNKCVTSSGDDVKSFGSGTILQDACTGTAYYVTFVKEYWLGIEEVGAGEEKLVEYADSGVNNFVCFGSDATPCPTDNLYRIIGVFGDKVKLIKYDYANSNLLGTDGDYQGTVTPYASYYKGELTTINIYYWNYNNDTSINGGLGSNEWSTSLFNKTNLNINYLNKIGTTWSNLIEDTTWKVSGHSTYVVTPKAMYTAEITNATKTYGPENGTSKIGLMYVSDYGFAAAPSAWTTKMNSYYSSSITSVNWMYMGLDEWTITPYSSYSDGVFFLSSNGGFDSYSSAHRGLGVRPVLYLKASVVYAGGSGIKDSPITLVV